MPEKPLALTSPELAVGAKAKARASPPPHLTSPPLHARPGPEKPQWHVALPRQGRKRRGYTPKSHRCCQPQTARDPTAPRSGRACGEQAAATPPSPPPPPPAPALPVRPQPATPGIPPGAAHLAVVTTTTTTATLAIIAIITVVNGEGDAARPLPARRLRRPARPSGARRGAAGRPLAARPRRGPRRAPLPAPPPGRRPPPGPPFPPLPPAARRSEVRRRFPCQPGLISARTLPRGD